jgi:hypothetical protein
MPGSSASTSATSTLPTVSTTATAALDRATTWCRDPASGPELRTLAKTLARWRAEILAHHIACTSNDRVAAANLTINVGDVNRPGLLGGSQTGRPGASRAKPTDDLPDATNHPAPRIQAGDSVCQLFYGIDQS